MKIDSFMIYYPAAMKNLKQWVCYKLVEDSGKTRKPPHSPFTGEPMGISQRKEYAGYVEAVNGMLTHSLNGIGFVFTADDDLTFVDLDHCIDNNTLSDFAQGILDLFPKTYVEISRSGEGLHIVCKGHIQRTIHSKTIEIYSEGQYMAFTGHCLSVAEPAEAQEILDNLWERFGTSENKAAEAQPVTNVNRSGYAVNIATVESMIEKSKHRTKFNQLYAGSEAGYPSTSEADQAFIDIVNHYCSGDESAVKEIWNRSSRAHRSKGKRQDYIDRMIRKAQETHSAYWGKYPAAFISEQKESSFVPYAIYRRKKMSDNEPAKRFRRPWNE